MPATSSSPNLPSSFINVLLVISSGRSGYTANAWDTVWIVSSAFFLSLGLGEVNAWIKGRAGRFETGLFSRENRFDIRRLRGALGDSGRSFPCDAIEAWSGFPAEPLPAEMTIHIRFQSV